MSGPTPGARNITVYRIKLSSLIEFTFSTKTFNKKVKQINGHCVR